MLTKSDATISSCGRFRYSLLRRWGEGSTAVFVMLNPSTADASQDDPTIRRCVGFAKREGCGALVVVNLFAFRATSPAYIKAASDPVGPENDNYVMEALIDADGPAIAAWGVHGSYRGRDKALRLLTDVPLYCLSMTKAGAPGHPLYIRADAPLMPF
jgi:hypothetical protein